MAILPLLLICVLRSFYRYRLQYQSVCKPFDYDKLEGQEISSKFSIDGHPVTVRLKVGACLGLSKIR